MMNFLLSHSIHKSGIDLLRQQPDIEVTIANKNTVTDYLDKLKEADGFLIRVGRIGRDVMEQSPKLKVIVRPGVGVDNIDVDAATDLGIPVVITPGANVRSVAEHTMALLYAISKDICYSYSETRMGNYAVRDRGAAIELQGRSVGMIGFGNIGRETAKVFRNNELKVHVYDPFVKPEAIEALGCIHEKNMYEMLAFVDVVSLHLPSMPETRDMLGKKEFDTMKEGSILINCARGDIVVEDALYDSLKSGHLAGAAVDLMCAEPMDPQNKLFTLPNFIATPHLATLTQEASVRVVRMAIEGAITIMRGERCSHIFNPKVYEHPHWNKR